MTAEKSKQTLIPKDDDEQWRKVLHGEIAPSVRNETHADAAKIRNYLLAKDEALAVNNAAYDDLNSISQQEARVIYQRAVEEIRARSATWPDIFKTYGVGALIGGLSVTVLYLAFFRSLETTSTTSQLPTLSTQYDLNFSDYSAINMQGEPEEFPNMLLIPDGVTNIGCAIGWDDTSGGCRSNEFPSHAVQLKPFEISQHEITVAQFSKFMAETDYVTDAESDNRGCVHQDTKAPGRPFVMNPALTWSNPGYKQDPSYPVTCVSWRDAQSYIAWLNEVTGEVYRLPTEAEWEHAARGGKATAYFWGSSVSNGNQTNYGGLPKDPWDYAAPVGSFPANAYSIQDMSGNVWEWVQDCWHDTYDGAPQDGSAWEDCKDQNVRVRRGGSWDMNAVGIRSAVRSKGARNDRSNLYGFRVAKDWKKPEK